MYTTPDAVRLELLTALERALTLPPTAGDELAATLHRVGWLLALLAAIDHNVPGQLAQAPG